MSEGASGKFAPPDWRDADQYRHLLDLDRAGWAWEWLRRHDAYEGQVEDGGLAAQRDKPGPWLVELSPYQLAACRRWGLCFCHVTKLPCAAGAARVGRAV